MKFPHTANRVRKIMARAGLYSPEVVEYRRLYHGAEQRSAGAWSWSAWDPEGRIELCGSQFPLSALEKCNRVSVLVEEGGTSLFPEGSR